MLLDFSLHFLFYLKIFFLNFYLLPYLQKIFQIILLLLIKQLSLLGLNQKKREFSVIFLAAYYNPFVIFSMIILPQLYNCLIIIFKKCRRFYAYIYFFSYIFLNSRWCSLNIFKISGSKWVGCVLISPSTIIL